MKDGKETALKMLIVRELFSSSRCNQQVLPGAGLGVPVMFVTSCWRVCCRNFQKGHSPYTHGVGDMWTALHNYSPFLINSPVSAETSSGSTGGTCINAHQERWLLLQPLKAPSLVCSEAAEPNMNLHFLLGSSQSHRLSPSTPAVHKISPVPHRAERWQVVVGCSFKHCSVVSPDWSADPVCLQSGGAVDSFGKFFGTWVAPVYQLPMEAM